MAMETSSVGSRDSGKSGAATGHGLNQRMGPGRAEFLDILASPIDSINNWMGYTGARSGTSYWTVGWTDDEQVTPGAGQEIRDQIERVRAASEGNNWPAGGSSGPSGGGGGGGSGASSSPGTIKPGSEISDATGAWLDAGPQESDNWDTFAAGAAAVAAGNASGAADQSGASGEGGAKEAGKDWRDKAEREASEKEGGKTPGKSTTGTVKHVDGTKTSGAEGEDQPERDPLAHDYDVIVKNPDRDRGDSGGWDNPYVPESNVDDSGWHRFAAGEQTSGTPTSGKVSGSKSAGGEKESNWKSHAGSDLWKKGTSSGKSTPGTTSGTKAEHATSGSKELDFYADVGIRITPAKSGTQGAHPGSPASSDGKAPGKPGTSGKWEGYRKDADKDGKTGEVKPGKVSGKPVDAAKPGKSGTPAKRPEIDWDNVELVQAWYYYYDPRVGGHGAVEPGDTSGPTPGGINAFTLGEEKPDRWDTLPAVIFDAPVGKPPGRNLNSTARVSDFSRFTQGEINSIANWLSLFGAAVGVVGGTVSAGAVAAGAVVGAAGTAVANWAGFDASLSPFVGEDGSISVSGWVETPAGLIGDSDSPSRWEFFVGDTPKPGETNWANVILAGASVVAGAVRGNWSTGGGGKQSADAAYAAAHPRNWGASGRSGSVTVLAAPEKLWDPKFSLGSNNVQRERGEAGVLAANASDLLRAGIRPGYNPNPNFDSFERYLEVKERIRSASLASSIEAIANDERPWSIFGNFQSFNPLSRVDARSTPSTPGYDSRSSRPSQEAAAVVDRESRWLDYIFASPEPGSVPGQASRVDTAPRLSDAEVGWAVRPVSESAAAATRESNYSDFIDRIIEGSEQPDSWLSAWDANVRAFNASGATSYAGWFGGSGPSSSPVSRPKTSSGSQKASIDKPSIPTLDAKPSGKQKPVAGLPGFSWPILGDIPFGTPGTPGSTARLAPAVRASVAASGIASVLGFKPVRQRFWTLPDVNGSTVSPFSLHTKKNGPPGQKGTPALDGRTISGINRSVRTYRSQGYDAATALYMAKEDLAYSRQKLLDGYEPPRNSKVKPKATDASRGARLRTAANTAVADEALSNLKAASDVAVKLSVVGWDGISRPVGIDSIDAAASYKYTDSTLKAKVTGRKRRRRMELLW